MQQNSLAVEKGYNIEKIELLLEKDYVDVTTEEEFKKISDNFRLLQRVKV